MDITLYSLVSALLALSACASIVALTVLIQSWKSISGKQFRFKAAQSFGLHHPHVQTQEDEIKLYKDLYHEIHNLEDNPSVLPKARDILISFLSDGLAKSIAQGSNSILSIESFGAESLSCFMRSKDHVISLEWERYIARRHAGGSREMFADREAATHWLRQNAPVKYVDGAWLGHIHKITTPFRYRKITKNAWQVMSEELGDGDLSKNHAHVYRRLMDSIAANLPGGDSIEFIHSKHGLNDVEAWKAAVAQLVISLFPHEFLPEILGFNMHFEMLTWDTMRAIKELKELSIDDYYFLLHVSIDNADSGHTAMALQIVIDYIEQVLKTEGKDAAMQTWRRVQAGFALSDSFTNPVIPSSDTATTSGYPETGHEMEVIRIFKAKAPVAHKLHCGCRMKIGGRSLVEWLDPLAFESSKWQMNFLDALSKAVPWIAKGNSSKSRFIKLISWKGLMFGAFTQAEVEVMKRWIDALAVSPPRANYWEFTKQVERSSATVFRDQDIRSAYPVYTPNNWQCFRNVNLETTDFGGPMQILSRVDLDRFLPLWFSHPCLLESFVSVPFKTCNDFSSALIRVLRAQYGFEIEGTGVSGMDELRRAHTVDLVDIGQEMMHYAGLQNPACLMDVLEPRNSEFATDMLHTSMKPGLNVDVLLGMAWAFVGLHEAMACSESFHLLSSYTKDALRTIAHRERDGLEPCRQEIEKDSTRYQKFCEGFVAADTEIRNCF